MKSATPREYHGKYRRVRAPMERHDAQRADRELSRGVALFIEMQRCLLIIAQSERILSMPAARTCSATSGNISPAAFSKLKRFTHAARH
jgi:hypothetical protein